MRVLNQKGTQATPSAIQAVFCSSNESNDAILQSIWRESVDAELDGDISLALEIHEQILAVIGSSYEAFLREGWLHYQAGGYTRALEFYEKASDQSPGSVAPLFGRMVCHVAMADSVKAVPLMKAVIDLEGLDRNSSMLPPSLLTMNTFRSLQPSPVYAFSGAA